MTSDNSLIVIFIAFVSLIIIAYVFVYISQKKLKKYKLKCPNCGYIIDEKYWWNQGALKNYRVPITYHLLRTINAIFKLPYFTRCLQCKKFVGFRQINTGEKEKI